MEDLYENNLEAGLVYIENNFYRWIWYHEYEAIYVLLLILLEWKVEEVKSNSPIKDKDYLGHVNLEKIQWTVMESREVSF
jgi:hypothetical protein